MQERDLVGPSMRSRRRLLRQDRFAVGGGSTADQEVISIGVQVAKVVNYPIAAVHEAGRLRAVQIEGPCCARALVDLQKVDDALGQCGLQGICRCNQM